VNSSLLRGELDDRLVVSVGLVVLIEDKSMGSSSDD